MRQREKRGRKGEEGVIKCRGGNSLRCGHFEHDRGRVYRCRVCRTYMGCHKCATVPQEVVCLRCHNWALDEGEAAHGKLLPFEKTKEFIQALEEKTLFSDNKKKEKADE